MKIKTILTQGNVNLNNKCNGPNLTDWSILNVIINYEIEITMEKKLSCRKLNLIHWLLLPKAFMYFFLTKKCCDK